jgi:hypothetical protein
MRRCAVAAQASIAWQVALLLWPQMLPVHEGERRGGMTQISSPGEVPELLHKADGVIDRADGNSDEQGEDEAVEEVAESDARLVADRVQFTRERENVGQECFDALVHRARLWPAVTDNRTLRGRSHLRVAGPLSNDPRQAREGRWIAGW